MTISLHHCLSSSQTCIRVSFWAECISEAVVSHGPLGTCPCSRAAYVWSYRHPAWYSLVEDQFLQDWSLKALLNMSENSRLEGHSFCELLSSSAMCNILCALYHSRKMNLKKCSLYEFFVWRYHLLEAAKTFSTS